MIVRIVAFEGLQPMVTEAFLKERGNIQRGMEKVKGSNESWKFWMVVIIAINIIGFAAVAFVLWKLYKHFENATIQLSKTMEATRFSARETQFSF